MAGCYVYNEVLGTHEILSREIYAWLRSGCRITRYDRGETFPVGLNREGTVLRRVKEKRGK